MCQFFGKLAKFWAIRDILRRGRNRYNTEPIRIDSSVSSLTTAGLSYQSSADETSSLVGCYDCRLVKNSRTDLVNFKNEMLLQP